MAIETIRLDFDKGRGKAVIQCGNRLFGLIRETFSVQDKAAKAMRRFRGGNIPTRKYIITPNGRYDIGMTSEILKRLKDRGVECAVIQTDAFKDAYNTKFGFYLNDGFQIEELNLKLRDYQMEGVRTALKCGSGVFLFPTGSGKTLLIATTIANILRNSPKARIFVVTLTTLVDQFVRDFISYGMDPSIISPWTGDNEFVDNRVVVAGNTITTLNLYDAEKEIQKLQRAVRMAEDSLKDYDRLTVKSKKDLEKAYANALIDLGKAKDKLDFNRNLLKYFRKVDVLMVDEVHQLKRGNAISGINEFIPTRHRFGYTGTMPEELIDQWNVIGIIGPVRQVVEREKLVGMNAITDVSIRMLNIRYKDSPDYDGMFDGMSPQDMLRDFQKEVDFLYHSEYRNGLIAKIAAKVDNNILIIVDRIEHGELLRDRIRDVVGDSKIVEFISGEMDDQERDRIKNLMETNSNVVCIAISKIFSTGVNVTGIYYLLFSCAWKAKVSIIQSVGRSVRTRKGKDMAVVFDLHDCLKYGNRHAEKRRGIYESEGFKITETEFREK